MNDYLASRTPKRRAMAFQGTVDSRISGVDNKSARLTNHPAEDSNTDWSK